MKALLVGRIQLFREELWRHTSILLVVPGFELIILCVLASFAGYHPWGFLVVCLLFSPILVPLTWFSYRTLVKIGDARLELIIGAIESRDSFTTHDEEHRPSENYRLSIRIVEGYAGRGGIEERLAGVIEDVVCLGSHYRQLPSGQPVFFRLVRASLLFGERRQLLSWEPLHNLAESDAEVDVSGPLVVPEEFTPVAGPVGKALTVLQKGAAKVFPWLGLFFLLLAIWSLTKLWPPKTAEPPLQQPAPVTPPKPSYDARQMPKIQHLWTTEVRVNCPSYRVSSFSRGKWIYLASETHLTRLDRQTGKVVDNQKLPPVSQFGASKGYFVPSYPVSEKLQMWFLVGSFEKQPTYHCGGIYSHGCNGALLLLWDGKKFQLASPETFEYVPWGPYKVEGRPVFVDQRFRPLLELDLEHLTLHKIEASHKLRAVDRPAELFCQADVMLASPSAETERGGKSYLMRFNGTPGCHIGQPSGRRLKAYPLAPVEASLGSWAPGCAVGVAFKGDLAAIYYWESDQLVEEPKN